jgi:hypothetical protein
MAYFLTYPPNDLAKQAGPPISIQLSVGGRCMLSERSYELRGGQLTVLDLSLIVFVYMMRPDRELGGNYAGDYQHNIKGSAFY